jgi:thiol-disulfide isomerase/thioredoxin
MANGSVSGRHRRVIARFGIVAMTGVFAIACHGHGAKPSTAVRDGRSAAASEGPPLVPATATDVLAAVERAHGDVVLVNLWATWCQPCKEEMPSLLRLDRELRGKGFKLILVSTDFPDVRADVERFLAAQRVDFPTYLKQGPDMEFIDGLDPRWSGSLPATILFARDGTRAQFWEGKASYETLTSRVKPLLAAPTDAGATTETPRVSGGER